MRALKITSSITRRDEQSMEKYLGEIAKFDVLTPEEELALFQQYKNGDKNVLEKIVNHNLRFVVSVAKQYQNIGFWLGDLVNEGNIGLIKAAKRFDETKGFKFISYAVWWIRQSIIQAINEKGRSIRVPLNVSSIASKVHAKRSELLQKTQREPTVKELAKEMDLSIVKVKRAIAAYKRTQSLDAPVNEDSDVSLAYLMEDSNMPSPDFNLAVEQSQQIEVQQLFKKLPKREVSILKMYFGIEKDNAMTLSDIGDAFGITRERARQIKDRGLRKLRHITNAQQLTFTMDS